jgi:hypothetical protein
MAETIYLKGVRMWPLTDGAPKFVKGSGVIAINELVKFLKDNPDYMSDYKGEPQVKFQLLDRGTGGLYFVVDTYKKQATPPDTNNDDLPF